MAENRLYRSETDKMLGGVCGGIAEVYDLDPSLVRIGALLLVFGMGSGLLAYLLAWLIIPSESEVKKRDTVEVEEESQDEESEESGDEE